MPTKHPRRYITAGIIDDLKRKMVFVGGPRQVGKTTLALALLKSHDIRHPGYLNWDDPKVRAPLRRGELPAGQKLVVLDEIHKYKEWRNLVKGFYDSHRDWTQHFRYHRDIHRFF